MPKIIVYTALKGKKDAYRNDILCFTDYNQFKTNRMNAKIYKVLPHLFLDVEYSIWVDANIFLKVSPEKLIQQLGHKDIAVIRHPNRTCIYDEANEVIKKNLDDCQIVKEQINRYKINGFKKNQGMAMCGVIIRKHTESMAKLNEQWWSEICRGSSRDQISFNYVFKKEINFIDWPGSYNNHLFYRTDHRTIKLFIMKYLIIPIKNILFKLFNYMK